MSPYALIRFHLPSIRLRGHESHEPGARDRSAITVLLLAALAGLLSSGGMWLPLEAQAARREPTAASVPMREGAGAPQLFARKPIGTAGQFERLWARDLTPGQRAAQLTLASAHVDLLTSRGASGPGTTLAALLSAAAPGGAKEAFALFRALKEAEIGALNAGLVQEAELIGLNTIPKSQLTINNCVSGHCATFSSVVSRLYDRGGIGWLKELPVGFGWLFDVVVRNSGTQTGTYYTVIGQEPAFPWQVWYGTLANNESPHAVLTAGQTLSPPWQPAVYAPTQEVSGEAFVLDLYRDIPIIFDDYFESFTKIVNVDVTAPTSTVQALASLQTSNTFTVPWTSTDIGSGQSGVQGVDLQFKVNGGAWQLGGFYQGTNQAQFNGVPGENYCFQTSAWDWVGHAEAFPNGNGDTCTTVAYTITVLANPTNGGSVGGGGPYMPNTGATVSASANAGFRFGNWTENGSVVSSAPFYNFGVTSNRTLTANFIPQCALTLNQTPGGTISQTAGGATGDCGRSVTVTASQNSGYTFQGWSNGASGTPYTFILNVNMTLSATFTQNSYSVNLSSSPPAGGTTSGGGNYGHGSTATVNALPATGYYFTVWTENGGLVSSNQSYTFTVTAPRSLVANFSLFVYTISTTPNPGNGGTTSGDGNYEYGTSATVTASPNTGYQFSNWTENGGVVSTSPSYTFTVGGNRSLAANFTALSYTIGVTPVPAQGGTTGGGGTYNHGATATLTANPNNGYQFLNWTENGSVVSTSPTYAFTVTGARQLEGNFGQNLRQIAATPNPPAGGTVAGGGAYQDGATATLTATPNTGYQFVSWTENGGVVSTSPTYNFTVASDRSLVANFSLLQYAVATSVAPVGAGSATGAGTYTHGATATVVAQPGTGYAFSHWSENGTVMSVSASYSFTVTRAISLVANFTPLQYTITAVASPAGSGSTTGSGTYNFGELATVTAAPNSGFTFLDWTENGATVSTNLSYSFTVTGARTVQANFSQNLRSITVSASPPEGGMVGGGGNYALGANAAVTAAPNSGYGFVNWTENGSEVSTSSTYNFTVAASRDLVAHFVADPVMYTLSITGGGNGAGTVTSSPAGIDCTITAGVPTGNCNVLFAQTETNIQLTYSPQTGSSFASWSGYCIGAGACVVSMASGDQTVGAAFTLNTYSITATPNPPAGGTTTGSGTYDHGTTATVNATPNSGYQFVNWTENGGVVSASQSYSFAVTGGRDLVAHFSTSSCTVAVIVNPPGAGTVTGAGTYPSGSVLALAASPAPGYQFVNWTEGGIPVFNGPIYTFTCSGNRTIVANFTPVVYTITAAASPTAGGSVTGGGAYNHGATATVTATANSGYQFANWTESGSIVSSSASYSFTVTANRTLVANFTQAPVQYTIGTTANPAAGGTTTGSAVYNSGATATVTATANSGYQFSNWTESGSIVSNSASYSFTVTANRTLVANFTQGSFNITLTVSPSGGGTVTGAGTYAAGTQTTVAATPATDYKFTNWIEAGVIVSTSPAYGFTVTGHRSLTANFLFSPTFNQPMMGLIVDHLLNNPNALNASRRAWCDAQGNNNGTCDLGDLLALLDKNPGMTLSPEQLAALMSLTQVDAPTRGKE